jgi:hypothetical protein
MSMSRGACGKLPSIIPSYVYTLFASVIVGALIIGACGLSVVNLKQEAEKQELSNIADYVAVKGMELASNAPADNLTSTVRFDVPPLIGNQIYWIRIQNDSAKAWVEVGFGNAAATSDQRAYIPTDLSALGTCTSDSGMATLEYYSDTAGDHLTLYGGN